MLSGVNAQVAIKLFGDDLEVLHENRGGLPFIVAPILTTMLLGAISNALDVPFVPARIRRWWRTGIRERIWNSRLGEWLARRLGAPERSRIAGAAAFRERNAPDERDERKA